MKTTLLVSLMVALVSPVSFAGKPPKVRDAGITCSTAGADTGYIVNITTNSKGDTHAAVSEETIAGPRQVATMKCKYSMGGPVVRIPDAGNPLLACEGKGYSLELSSGGFWFHIWGTLSKDDKEVADFSSCTQQTASVN